MNPVIDPSIAVYHEFLLNYRKSERCIHSFFEGRDDAAYYGPPIRELCDPQFTYFAYRCNGKKPLLSAADKIVRKIQRDGAPDRTLFFVDKDLDDFVGPPQHNNDIYTTEYYSIENYLVSEEALEVFLHDLLRLPTSDPWTMKSLSEFRKEYRRFTLLGRELSVWIIWHRLKGNRPNLNNITMQKVFPRKPFWLNRLSSARIKTIDRQSGVNTDLAEFIRNRKSIRKTLIMQNPKRYLRGKWELLFFALFLRSLVQYLQQNCEDKVSCTHSLTPSVLLDLLPPRLAYPAPLRRYISFRQSP